VEEGCNEMDGNSGRSFNKKNTTKSLLSNGILFTKKLSNAM
jgi:hypothetical protein